MIHTEDFITAYMRSRSNKRRSVDQAEFELHWERNLLRLMKDVENRSSQPSAYMFISMHPKPREVFASDMGSRILHHYLDIRMRPKMENVLGDHTFNNREKMGQIACQNALIDDIERISRNYTKNTWIIKIDLTGCFPNIIQQLAYEQMDRLLKGYKDYDRDELLYILRVCTLTPVTEHCEVRSSRERINLIPRYKSVFSKPPGIGACLGFLVWQNAVNLYFKPVNDWLESIGVTYERYVDDWAFVTDNKEAFLSYVLPQLRIRFAMLGAVMNEKKFYCQHVTKGLEWLGAHIKPHRSHLNRRTIRTAVERARKLKPSADNVDYAIAVMNSYLGMYRNSQSFRQAEKIVSALDERWNKYMTFDKKTLRMVALTPYTYRNRLINKYNLKSAYYDKRRKGRGPQKPRRKAARTARSNEKK